MSALISPETGVRLSADEPHWRGPAGELLDLEFDPTFDPERIAQRPPTMWRYREALPINDDASIVTLGEGCTPMIPYFNAGVRGQVLLKLDTLFPSGSYKDRGASVLISKARELGITRVVEDSSGNAGAAIATYCARAGIACDIYVPADTSPAKLEQIRLAGATLHPIEGDRDATATAALTAAEHTYYASHVWNPYFFHGTKTCAYEIAEQLGWNAPDTIVTPVGNGTLLLGLHLGFSELRAAGLIERLPRLIAVQAEACAPLVSAWRGRQRKITPRPTVAEGIAIPQPRRADQCLNAVRETKGEFVPVSERELNKAWLAALAAGLYIEPTSAAALAPLGHCDVGSKAVALLTGHGLKAAGKPAKIASTPP